MHYYERKARNRWAVVQAYLCTLALTLIPMAGALIGKSLAVEAPQPEIAPPAPTEIKTVEPTPVPVSLGDFVITHYCPCELCCGVWADGYTSTGTKATEGRTIAVDPDVIPYGSQVVIAYEDGTEERYIAEDCGSAIQGSHVDVYMDSHQAALEEGVKRAEVYIVEE